MIRISLIRDSKKSNGKFLKLVKREITKRSQPLIEERFGSLIVEGEFHHFGDQDNGGEESFEFTIREMSIHKR
jgi:hypothetical protein